MNIYKEVVLWIEDQVKRDGFFEVKLRHDSNQFEGFACSCQHVKSRPNLVELVAAMRKAEMEYPSKRERELRPLKERVHLWFEKWCEDHPGE